MQGSYKLILNTYLFTYSLRLIYHHLQILRTNAYNNDSTSEALFGVIGFILKYNRLRKTSQLHNFVSFL